MGQYYKPIVLETITKKNGQSALRPRAFILAHDIHYRFKNYADKWCTTYVGLKLLEHSYMKNHMCQRVEALLMPGGDWYKQPIVWAGDYADTETDTRYNWLDKDGDIREAGVNLYSFGTDELKIIPKAKKIPAAFKYILNHDTKQFVDKTKVPKTDGWQLHPLPLLTCEGNGRGGGGDYCNEDEFPIIGTWARHRISIETSVPDGYTELVFDLLPR